METRQYSIISVKLIDQQDDWEGLVTLGKVVNKSFRDDKMIEETRLFLLSFSDILKFPQVVRGHWGIENKLHWVLDVSFNKDQCRVRKDHVPENFSTIRKLALNLLRLEKKTKLSMPRKIAKASRKRDYLDEILKIKLI